MPVDWTQLLEKKTRLGKPCPGSAELAELERIAASVLSVSEAHREQDWAISPGYGARTRALIATRPGTEHGFSSVSARVVVKLFRGPARDYLRFHADYFRRIPALFENARVQQSLAAATTATGQAWAVLEYIPGTTLRETLEHAGDTQKLDGTVLLTELITRLWIPLWSAGLRFKDCHPGNFVVGTGRPLVMIDAEQMRKSAFELIDQSVCWQDRDRHEGAALRRLPGLIRELVRLSPPPCSGAAVNRQIRAAIQGSSLPQALAALGRGEDEADSVALAAYERLLATLQAASLLP